MHCGGVVVVDGSRTYHAVAQPPVVPVSEVEITEENLKWAKR